MKTNAASSCVVARRTPVATNSAFTLVEVMIALVLVSMMCASTFAGIQLVSRMAVSSAVRSEAHRIMQAEAERLTSVGYSDFTPSGDQSVVSSLKTTFSPGNQAALEYPPAGTAGRVTFTKRVVNVSTSTTTRTLRVEVQWTWQGKVTVISTPVMRAI